ncbi:polyketide synthase [Coccidioides immitis RMSCC 2394]|uniref:Polyketide synthase n=1 Tax=Coccidioides immitis RMSCC 2394 TaxID=404692 RepID=A0A0J6Y772_COCIT|nr:polyketide synthase [Coccidioides immitis RMSCC 2394]
MAILKHNIGNNAVFLEVGPRRALAGPLRQIFAEASSPTPYVSAMTRNKDCTVSFLAAIGALYWYESRLSKEWRNRKYPYHDLLGSRVIESSNTEPAQDPDALPRKLNVRKWFKKMAKGGLNLGGSFQTLDMMASSTSEQQGMGHIVNGRQEDEANYYIHPTILDTTLQILGAAAVNGYARKTRTWLPTSINKISLYSPWRQLLHM